MDRIVSDLEDRGQGAVAGALTLRFGIGIFRVRLSGGLYAGKPVRERSSGGERGHGPAEWVDQELADTAFVDERLGERVRALLGLFCRQAPGTAFRGPQK